MDVIKDLHATSSSVFLMRIQEKKLFQISVPGLSLIFKNQLDSFFFLNLMNNIHHELILFEQTTEVHRVQLWLTFC